MLKPAILARLPIFTFAVCKFRNICMYIKIYTYICIYKYVYIYTHTCRERNNIYCICCFFLDIDIHTIFVQLQKHFEVSIINLLQNKS